MVSKLISKKETSEVQDQQICLVMSILILIKSKHLEGKNKNTFECVAAKNSPKFKTRIWKNVLLKSKKCSVKDKKIKERKKWNCLEFKTKSNKVEFKTKKFNNWLS